MRPHVLRVTVCAMALAVTAACGSADPAQEPATVDASSVPAASAPDGQAPAPSQAPSEEVVITISDFAFTVPETVPAGAEITVVNEDSSFHTVTADDGTFDVDAPGGDSVTFTAPDEPGEYSFVCTPHPNMTATLVVV